MPTSLERTLDVKVSTLGRPPGKETVMSHNALQPERVVGFPPRPGDVSDGGEGDESADGSLTHPSASDL